MADAHDDHLTTASNGEQSVINPGNTEPEDQNQSPQQLASTRSDPVDEQRSAARFPNDQSKNASMADAHTNHLTTASNGELSVVNSVTPNPEDQNQSTQQLASIQPDPADEQRPGAHFPSA